MADENSKNNIPISNDNDGAQSNRNLDDEAPRTRNNLARDDGDMGEENDRERLERLGGEPAPVITPEEFARLQKAGQVHIDSRGRVRTARRSGSEAGVSLRKRRAWYGT
jgi:hypothetical protein